MKRIFPIFLISLYALIATAVPAKRERCLLTLADGTTIEATSVGDELMHFYLSDDGRPLLCGNEGKQKQANGGLPEPNEWLPDEKRSARP